jgi:hypothetical protein
LSVSYYSVGNTLWGKSEAPERRATSALRVAVSNNTAEYALMKKIYDLWQPDILKATRNSLVEPAFLAALTANESSGQPAAQAFEPHIYRLLWEVATGQAPAFGSIGAQQLFGASASNFDCQAEPPGAQTALGQNSPPAPLTAGQEQVLRKMATSWGLTQIMGYQIVGRTETVQDLLDPLQHYQFAVVLIQELARGFHLDVARDFEPLFRSWNAGHPTGETFDPNYVSHGLERMQLYDAIASG